MDRQHGKYTSTITGANNTIIVDLAVVMFEDHETQVVYCPALDVYGYGMTDQEAVDSFEINLQEFFAYTINKNTLYKLLEGMGWKIKRGLRQKFTPPQLSQLLSKNQVFSEIFDTHNFRKVDRRITIPACV